jgi:glycosyltransferase involved in cell wall biosynthesis
MNLVIFSELSQGGIADYTHDQASALAARGLDVTVLCSPVYLEGRETAGYEAVPLLKELRADAQRRARALRRTKLGLGIIHNVGALCEYLKRNSDSDVLTHFSEYLAPLWAWRLRRFTGDRSKFHTILHDPVRNYRVGPRWWHEWSVREAFSMMSTAFVHTKDIVDVPAHVRTVSIPYGIHAYPKPRNPRNELRQVLGIGQDKKLVTAFGYIRDNKNLDLLIEAIRDMPDIYLLVAGPEQGGGNRSIAFYKDLALKFGCGDRCLWMTKFLNSEDTADVLSASDLSALAYSRSFVSSSAALSVTTNYRVPCLVSGGSKSTESLIRRYNLGIWVEPDSAEAIKAGLLTWRHQGISPDWEAYTHENSWAINAKLVHQALLAAAERRSGSGH